MCVTTDVIQVKQNKSAEGEGETIQKIANRDFWETVLEKKK